MQNQKQSVGKKGRAYAQENYESGLTVKVLSRGRTVIRIAPHTGLIEE